jgi:hypothetical protein
VFDGFRSALGRAGVSASKMLDAEESKLKARSSGGQK